MGNETDKKCRCRTWRSCMFTAGVKEFGLFQGSDKQSVRSGILSHLRAEKPNCHCFRMLVETWVSWVRDKGLDVHSKGSGCVSTCCLRVPCPPHTPTGTVTVPVHVAGYDVTEEGLTGNGPFRVGWQAHTRTYTYTSLSPTFSTVRWTGEPTRNLNSWHNNLSLK